MLCLSLLYWRVHICISLYKCTSAIMSMSIAASTADGGQICPAVRQVIYGDTDSIMIDTATRAYEDVRRVGAAVKAEVKALHAC